MLSVYCSVYYVGSRKKNSSLNLTQSLFISSSAREFFNKPKGREKTNLDSSRKSHYLLFHFRVDFVSSKHRLLLKPCWADMPTLSSIIKV